MQLEIQIDPDCTEPKVILRTSAMTEEVTRILSKLSDQPPQILSGVRQEKLEVIDQEDLIRVYANAGKVFAVTGKGEYTIRLRLYELEQRLNPSQFVRISNSEIINIRRVSSFDLGYTGTICVALQNGDVTYVSRRYVARIKKLLGV